MKEELSKLVCPILKTSANTKKIAFLVIDASANKLERLPLKIIYFRLEKYSQTL
jgi:hypothetical protein